MSDFDRSSMLEMFIYEMNHLIENLEQTVLDSENGFSPDAINEIFRIMHTIKGSAAMMLYDDISTTAHAVEDLFFYLRENKVNEKYAMDIGDIVLEAMDFIKMELSKIENGIEVSKDGNEEIVERIKVLLDKIKEVDTDISDNIISDEAIDNKNIEQDFFYNEPDTNLFDLHFTMLDKAEMKHIRAFTISSNYEALSIEVKTFPEDLFKDESESYIAENGFCLQIQTDNRLNIILREAFKSTSTELANIREIIGGAKIHSKTKVFSVSIVFNEKYTNDDLILIMDTIESFVEGLEIIKLNTEKLVKELELVLYTYEIGDTFKSILNDNEYIQTFKIKEIDNSIKKVIDSHIDEPIEKVKIKEVKEIPKEIKNLNTNINANTPENTENKGNATTKSLGGQVISVNVSKLDQLLNLVGELVTSEAMVTQNSDLEGLELESFHKDARQLHKIINDVQDIVMSMRMVPLSSVFLKMNRIARDMSRKLNKNVKLEIIGEETEVDKNIIEHIQDPIMHIIRNAIDHGIEDTSEERIEAGKDEVGLVTLEAKNSGGDVLIYIRDDGKGLNIEKIYAKAVKQGLIPFDSDQEFTEKEIQQFIFRPGFSTNDQVTNYSGRGVGMDVVLNNIQLIGGSVEVDSSLGRGSSFVLKIPLTLAIIDGMLIKIGDLKYTIPIISIRQSFKTTSDAIHTDPSGNEMIKVRGEMYNIIRLSDFFGISSTSERIEDGIMLLVEDGTSTLCLFADELLGEYPVVVKSLPKYINGVRAISGCTLLGNGDISLIIDITGFFQ